jgi:hypothetical protein
MERGLQVDVCVEREDWRLRDLSEQRCRRIAPRSDDLADKRLARHDALERAVFRNEHRADVGIRETLACVARRVTRVERHRVGNHRITHLAHG